MKRQAEILKNNEQQFRKLLLYPDELRGPAANFINFFTINFKK